jgi:DNA polymerase-1
MARIINTQTLSQEKLSVHERLQVYNALDCCVTRELIDILLDQLTDETSLIYDFQRALQAPVLEMELRGIRIDMNERRRTTKAFERRLNRAKYILKHLATAVWGKDLNYNSPKQLKEFFYDRLDVPPITASAKGKKRITTNHEALEKMRGYLYAKPIVNAIITCREINKKLGVLRTGVDHDKRMRTSYNICGTKTGRWSSSASAFGSGTNFQNITDELRKIFVADPGKKLAYIDLEQAESRAVGLLVWQCTKDSSYLDACETDDLHTTVCRMVWPDLAWTDDPIENRETASEPYYRHFSYRHMAKRGGHGTNYYGKPRTMAMHLKVTTSVMEAFQKSYFSAFPGIRGWHTYVAAELQTRGSITTPLGRKRNFFGRRYEDATLREAIAYVPQSMVADILNLGLWRVWKYEKRAELLAQVHDAILIQYDEEVEEEVLTSVQDLMKVPVTLAGRTIIIPTEASVGWNWAHYDTENPNGLKKWEGSDGRARRDIPLLH